MLYRLLKKLDGYFPPLLQFIFATATDGKIKAWLYDHQGPRVDYEAPGRSTTTMAYSADGTRFLRSLIFFFLFNFFLSALYQEP